MMSSFSLAYSSLLKVYRCWSSKACDSIKGFQATNTTSRNSRNFLCIATRDRLSMLVAGAHQDDARLNTSAIQLQNYRVVVPDSPGSLKITLATAITDAVSSLTTFLCHRPDSKH
jgi:hypothetical protein